MRNRIIVGALLVLSVVWILRCCDRDRVKPGVTILPPGTVAIVNIESSRTGITTSQDQTNVVNYGHGVVVTVKPNGKVDVKAKTIGWTFDAGLAYSNRNRLSLACELGYWRRLGWLVGVNLYPLYPNAWTALAYRVQWRKLNNMSLYAGIDTDTKIVTGIFWRFGNS